MAFKFFDELTAAAGAQTLPEPAYIHNPDTAAITLTVTQKSNLFSTMKSGASVLSSFHELPTLLAAQGATDYNTTSSGRGSGAVITITTTDVGEDLGAFASGHTSGGYFAGSGIPFGDGVQTYTPTSDGAGTGFTVKFAVNGTAPSQTIDNLEVISAGSGYTVGQVLTFTAADLGEFTRTLTADDISEVFQPTTAIVKSTSLGNNYKTSDWIYLTMTETVEQVDYTYDVKFQIADADLTSNSFTYVLGVGQTTPFQVDTFAVNITTDVLAIS
jgi:hypothetical protein